MTTSLEIRRARPDDAVAIAALLGELGYPTPATEVPRRLAALRDDENAMLLAIGPTGARVGLIALHVMPLVHHAAPNCYIMALVVGEGARGMGVGRQLLAAAEDWAREHGCGKMTVSSAEHRADAHEFYPRCGYPYTGRRFGKQLG